MKTIWPYVEVIDVYDPKTEESQEVAAVQLGLEIEVFGGTKRITGQPVILIRPPKDGKKGVVQFVQGIGNAAALFGLEEHEAGLAFQMAHPGLWINTSTTTTPGNAENTPYGFVVQPRDWPEFELKK